jgi:hypothetical protein
MPRPAPPLTPLGRAVTVAALLAAAVTLVALLWFVAAASASLNIDW